MRDVAHSILNLRPPPRFMTDDELREHFGLSERALYRLRLGPDFPRRDEVIKKTDRCAVEIFFDRRSGITSTVGGGASAVIDGKENFDGISKKKRPARVSGP